MLRPIPPCASALARLTAPLSPSTGALIALAISLLLVSSGCGPNGDSSGGNAGKGEVVLYASLDDAYSRPLMDVFTKQTGIAVRFQTDNEQTKTTGLVSKLISEKARPRCDVFWNNEIVQTIHLKKNGVLVPFTSTSADDIPAGFKDPEKYWVGFAARARVIIYNRDKVGDDVPDRWTSLTDPAWKGKPALARPLNGTTASHFAVLWAKWGPEKTKAFFNDVLANDVKIAAGNAQVMMLTSQGTIPWGFTDTDDFHVAKVEGKPVGVVFPDTGGEGTLLIPNTVCKIKGGPNPENADKLIDFILSRQVEETLAKGRSAQIPVRTGIAMPTGLPGLDKMKVMAVDWAAVGAVFATSHDWLSEALRGK